LKRGDVVLIVAQGELGKPRPAVIVQSDDLGDDSSSVILCPMSSEVVRRPLTGPVVEPSEATGLRIRSQIMTDKIVSLRRDRIRRVIGKLDGESMEHLDRALLIVLGLSR
jgi:mRNA interferase MazF